MICATWMDRPLSVAGRVLVQENGTIVSRLVALDRDLLMIPSVAIHMNREVNDKASFNKQVDMLPVLGGACEEGALKKLIAEELQVSEEQILGSDLFLYVREKGHRLGLQRGVHLLRPSGRSAVRLRHPERSADRKERPLHRRGSLL